MIQLHNTTKLYGTVIGVNDISLELEPGAYGLLGPNGSGKTTLLNLITGQLSPTIGTVQLFDQHVSRDQRVLGHVGLCPAMDLLPMAVDGIDWVQYMTELYGFSAVEAAQRAHAALDLVGLDDARHRAIAGYSRGMKQRVKLAQAIAHEPQLLILDEPFSGLDPVARYQMTMFLREWISRGKSVLMASHILHEVEAVVSHYLLIYGGRLLASGTTDEIFGMLDDYPREIEIVCDDAARLALLVQQQPAVDSVQFREDGEGLTIITRKTLEVYQQLPAWLEDQQVTIREVTSSDESLQALLETLMKVHRGELG
jgi:ABC-2 type transport system ATP-binding protein